MASGHRINRILVRGSLECKYLQVGNARSLRPGANAAGMVAAGSWRCPARRRRAPQAPQKRRNLPAKRFHCEQESFLVVPPAEVLEI